MTTLPSPDPARGLFETLLVVEEAPIELGAHLDRLSRSLEALFGASLPAGLAGEAAERAGGLGLGRMRITVSPTATGARVKLATEDVNPADFFPAWERGADLRAAICHGGLGCHKWADRRPLERTGDGAVPLLLDRGGEVLEAGRANLFAAFGDVLATPPADGRILPGIARAGAIAAAREARIEVVERRLERDQLLAADEVFLTGSVRGVEPARSLDGTALAVAGGLSRRVGAGLRRRWLGAPSAAAAQAPAAVPPPGQLAR
jgi:para-aminobenzoate synthetase / 4-amino-4-deoxychorismate lyase